MSGSYLTHQFLIAMPTMGDPNFDHTVTYICEHNDDGALGLVVNRPTGMQLSEIFRQMSLDASDETVADAPVLQGGPVQQERGFVIHDQGGDWGSSLEVSDGIHVTTSRDILEAMAEGEGPNNPLVVVGYASRGAAPLDTENADNPWLTVPASKEILFDIPYGDRWRAAAALLGIDIDQISTDVGHA